MPRRLWMRRAWYLGTSTGVLAVGLWVQTWFVADAGSAVLAADVVHHLVDVPGDLIVIAVPRLVLLLFGQRSHAAVADACSRLLIVGLMAVSVISAVPVAIPLVHGETSGAGVDRVNVAIATLAWLAASGIATAIRRLGAREWTVLESAAAHSWLDAKLTLPAVAVVVWPSDWVDVVACCVLVALVVWDVVPAGRAAARDVRAAREKGVKPTQP